MSIAQVPIVMALAIRKALGPMRPLPAKLATKMGSNVPGLANTTFPTSAPTPTPIDVPL
jgi:hypothetical protein